jgi:hypothetical protein
MSNEEITSGELLIKVAKLKAKAELAESNYRDAQEDLITLLSTGEDRSVTAQCGTNAITGTLVTSETLSINEEGLAKALGAKVWAKCTKRVLDKKKLEALITTGEVNAVVVAANSSETARKPYVRISTKKVK